MTRKGSEVRILYGPPETAGRARSRNLPNSVTDHGLVTAREDSQASRQDDRSTRISDLIVLEDAAFSRRQARSRCLAVVVGKQGHLRSGREQLLQQTVKRRTGREASHCRGTMVTSLASVGGSVCPTRSQSLGPPAPSSTTTVTASSCETLTRTPTPVTGHDSGVVEGAVCTRAAAITVLCNSSSRRRGVTDGQMPKPGTALGRLVAHRTTDLPGATERGQIGAAGMSWSPSPG